MYYDYTHKKADAVAEVVHNVSDESSVDGEMHLYAEDAETSKTALFRATKVIQKESKLWLSLF